MSLKEILIFAISAISTLFSTGSRAQTLEIEITNIQKFGGKVNIAIFDSPSQWLEKPVKTASVVSEADTETISFELPYGTYAISVYQDVNANDEMDTNFMSIPKEPIAFGNNYRPFGKPKFEAAAFDFSPDYQRQSLKLYKIL